MGALQDRVAIITGAGRGIGRAHALRFAAEGASVVVNDVGGASDGSPTGESPAEQVVAEIVAQGGHAVADQSDVADEDAAEQLLQLAIDQFGRIDVVVNNAGILRDRMIVNMTTADWDDVIRVHLRAHFLMTRGAARHWRERSRRGENVGASLINTSSTSGLIGQAGQANYGTAKLGIAALTTIAQIELERYDVRVNAIAPAARTRLTADIPGSGDREREAQESIAATGFDPRDPDNIARFAAYLATEDCPIKGRVFFVRGGTIRLFHPFATIDGIERGSAWTIDELREAAPRLGDVPIETDQMSAGPLADARR